MIPMRAWVLNMESTRYEHFDPIAAATIVRLCEAADVKLVISSSWRTDGYEAVVKTLERAGIDRKYLHEDWRTVSLGTSIDLRRNEILLWLGKHPKTVKFAILDDVDLNIANQVVVSLEDGLLLEHQRTLFNLFGVEMQ